MSAEVNTSPTKAHSGSESPFFRLPIELREQIYGHYLSSLALPHEATYIMLRDEANFVGTPLEICCKLRWTSLLADRRMAAEGVQYGFKRSVVRICGGPWVVRRWLERIGLTSINDNRNERNVLYQKNSAEPAIVDDECAKVPVNSWGWHSRFAPPNPYTDYTFNSGKIVLSWIRRLELDWPGRLNGMDDLDVIERTTKFEILPLFELMTKNLTNLESLIVPLHYRATTDGPRTRHGLTYPNKDFYFARLISFGLIFLLRGCIKSNVTIRYRPDHQFAALNPEFSMHELFERGLWEQLVDGKMTNVLLALTEAKSPTWFMCQSSQSAKLDERSLHVDLELRQWDPMRMLDRLGDEVDISFSVRPGGEEIGSPTSELGETLWGLGNKHQANFKMENSEDKDETMRRLFHDGIHDDETRYDASFFQRQPGYEFSYFRFWEDTFNYSHVRDSKSIIPNPDFEIWMQDCEIQARLYDYPFNKDDAYGAFLKRAFLSREVDEYGRTVIQDADDDDDDEEFEHEGKYERGGNVEDYDIYDNGNDAIYDNDGEGGDDKKRKFRELDV